MADSISKEKRSWNMSQIRSKDTSGEVLVRKYLFAKGFRFRKNVSSLPGKPDIVLPKYRTIIFIHGCFWHGHPGCKRAFIPKSNQEYWIPKLLRNKQNDMDHRKALEQLGWKVIIIWECELKKAVVHSRLEKLIEEIKEGSSNGTD